MASVAVGRAVKPRDRASQVGAALAAFSTDERAAGGARAEGDPLPPTADWTRLIRARRLPAATKTNPGSATAGSAIAGRQLLPGRSTATVSAQGAACAVGCPSTPSERLPR